ncbi:MAG: efflux RND transporter permease subunit [Methyloligellaceae bacterium]
MAAFGAPVIPKKIPSKIFSYFIEHRTAANLIFLFMLVSGLASVMEIRKQFFPDVSFEVIYVTVPWSGVGPQEIDRAVVSRLEPRLRAIEGIDEVYATAREGVASFRLEFQTGWDIEAALDETRSVLDEANDLPEDVDEHTIRRARFRDRVTDVLVIGQAPLNLLEQYAEELRTKLFALGITKSSISGMASPEIRVDVNPESIERYRLTLNEISQAIARETGTQPVGEVDKGTARIRTEAENESTEEIGEIAIRSRPDGTKLRVKDVAAIYEESLSRNSALFRDGVPLLRVTVERDAQGDAIEIQKQVEKVVAKINSTLPQGIEMTLARTRAEAISARLDLLLRNGLGGLAIVLVLLFLFLSSRTAFWVAAGIPAAMSATIALMFFFGFTLNMVSLFALILCLGIVVDDAIVVGEYTDQLHQAGLPPDQAAAHAAQRMALPVFSASITTVIAFVGLTFVSGRFGRFMEDMPFTVAVVVLASLLECFLVLPAHMRHSLTYKAKKTWIDIPSEVTNRGFRWFREHMFRPFIYWVIKLRYPTVAAAFLLLCVSLAAVVDRTVKWRFFVAPERGTISANIAMLPGASREDTRAMLNEMERALKATNDTYKEKYGRPPVELAITKIGGTTGRGLRGSDTKDPDRLGGMDISLIDPDERPYSAFQFIFAWRDAIKRSPKLERLALRGERRGPGGDDIHVRLFGADTETLKTAAIALDNRLSQFAAVSSVEDDLTYDKPELIVKLTSRGEALGFSTETVARYLRQRLDGIEATSFARNEHEVKVKVRLPEEKLDASYIFNARLPLPEGNGFVPLSSIAEIEEQQSFSIIRRENGEPVVSVTGDLGEDPAAGEEVIRRLNNELLPEVAATYGISYSLGGLAEQEKEFLSDVTLGAFACLIGIYLTLTWVFGSWIRPFTIMLVIPFGLIGAIWGHYIHGVPLTMFSVVGLIGMAGIIINDSIVLVTTIDERKLQKDMFSAIIEGTCNRLRAVILTSLTTVGGLTPLLFEQSRQAAFLKPTVVTLVYGLGFGLVLVILITPSMIAIQQDLTLRAKSLRRFAKIAVRPGRTRLGQA